MLAKILEIIPKNDSVLQNSLSEPLNSFAILPIIIAAILLTISIFYLLFSRCSSVKKEGTKLHDFSIEILQKLGVKPSSNPSLDVLNQPIDDEIKQEITKM